MSEKNDKDAKELYNLLLEEICLEQIFQVEIELSIDDETQYTSKYDTDKPGKINNFDVFNNINSKETYECVCPNCQRTLGALRYAPHLEKCLGMGRISSRIASRRLLASSNSGKDISGNKLLSDDSDTLPQNDAEWTIPKATRRVDRKKRDKPRRRGKPKKLVAVTAVNIFGEDVKPAVVNSEEKHHITGNICGVISEHTGKLCNRSTRCPKHTDEQRSNARQNVVLGEEINADFKLMTVEESKATTDLGVNKKEITAKPIVTQDLPASTTPTKRSERHYKTR